jgi:hypothetical protein
LAIVVCCFSAEKAAAGSPSSSSRHFFQFCSRCSSRPASTHRRRWESRSIFHALRFARGRSLSQDRLESRLTLNGRADDLQLRIDSPALAPELDEASSATARRSGRSYLQALPRATAVSVDQVTYNALMLCLIEAVPLVLRWGDFVHERQLSPETEAPQSWVVSELRLQLADRLRSRSHHAEARAITQARIKAASGLPMRQIAVDRTYGERGRKVIKPPTDAIELLRSLAPAPDKLCYPVRKLEAGSDQGSALSAI